MLIREATVDDVSSIAAVHVTSWLEHYTGIVDQRLIDERDIARRTAMWQEIFERGEYETFVAQESSGAVVGFASGRAIESPEHGFDSYLATLYLVADAKGHGTGRALMRALARKLLDAGCRSMWLRVLRLNPARAFYERLGARLLPDGLPVEPDEFDDVIYVFDDLRALAFGADAKRGPGVR